MPEIRRSRGINRVIDILDHLQKSDAPLLISEIADQIQAPKSTVYEIVNLLISRSLLEITGDDKRVFLGRKLYMYAAAYQHHFPLIGLARPFIEKLALETGEIAELTTIVDWKEGILISERGKRSYWWGGSRNGISSPLPLTSAGQLLCSHMSKEEMASFFKTEDFQYDGETKTTIDEFYKRCQTAKKNGYGVANGLLDKYLSAVSAPLFENRLRVMATVCIIFPTGEMESRFDEFIDKAFQTRDSIQKLLYNPKETMP